MVKVPLCTFNVQIQQYTYVLQCISGTSTKSLPNTYPTLIFAIVHFSVSNLLEVCAKVFFFIFGWFVSEMESRIEYRMIRLPPLRFYDVVLPIMELFTWWMKYSSVGMLHYCTTVKGLQSYLCFLKRVEKKRIVVSEKLM